MIRYAHVAWCWAQVGKYPLNSCRICLSRKYKEVEFAVSSWPSTAARHIITNAGVRRELETGVSFDEIHLCEKAVISLQSDCIAHQSTSYNQQARAHAPEVRSLSETLNAFHQPKRGDLRYWPWSLVSQS